MLRAGIIGCGGITERRHGPVLASLNDRVKIEALADLAQERTELMGGKLGVAAEHLYTNWENMLAQEELDLMEKLHFESLRLGLLLDDITRAEPYMRDADIIGFDMKALSWQASDDNSGNPNGIDGRSIHALAR